MKDDDWGRREPPTMHPERRAEGFEPIGAVIARLVEKVKEKRGE